MLEPLSQTEQTILALEKIQWRSATEKEKAIGEALEGLTVESYRQMLQDLIWTAHALSVEPVLVERLRREAGADH